MWEQNAKRTAGLRAALTFPISLILHLLVVAAILFVAFWQVEPVLPVYSRSVTYYDPEPVPIVFHQDPAIIRTDPGDRDRQTQPPSVDMRIQTEARVEKIVPIGTPNAADGPFTDPGPAWRQLLPQGAATIPDSGPTVNAAVVDDVMVITAGVVAPVLVHKTTPEYSKIARELRLEGTVVLRAIVSMTGAVESVQVVTGVHPFLDAAAVKAVQQWRYKPATLLNGKPVRVSVPISVTFRLKR